MPNDAVATAALMRNLRCMKSPRWCCGQPQPTRMVHMVKTARDCGNYQRPPIACPRSRLHTLGLRERPVDVLAHHGRRLVAPCAERIAQRRVGRVAQRVADGNREVALPALMADAPDRAAFGAAQE